MKSFNIVPKIKWDESFWVNDFPNIRIERLIDILKEFSNENSLQPDRMHEVFFTELQNQSSTGLGLILHRMDHGFSNKKMGYLDPLMRTVYSTLIKPHYFATSHPNALSNMLALILNRGITLDLKVEILTDIWTQFVLSVPGDQERVEIADAFLLAISSDKEASTILAQLIQSQSSFLDFLLSPTITDITRFEKCIGFFNKDDYLIIKQIDADVLKTIFLVAEADEKCPAILMRAERLGSQSVCELWKAAVEPFISKQPEVSDAFLNALFTLYNSENKHYFFAILAYCIQHSDSFKQSLLTSNHLENCKIEVICNLGLPIDETISIITNRLNDLIQTDRNNALKFVRQLPPININNIALLNKLWNLIETTDESLELASWFIYGLLDIPFDRETLHDFIKQQTALSAYFRQSFMTCDQFKIKHIGLIARLNLSAESTATILAGIWESSTEFDKKSFLSKVVFENKAWVQQNYCAILPILLQKSSDLRAILLSRDSIIPPEARLQFVSLEFFKRYLNLFPENDSDTLIKKNLLIHDYFKQVLSTARNSKSILNGLTDLYPHLKNNPNSAKQVLLQLNKFIMQVNEKSGSDDCIKPYTRLLNEMSVHRELGWFLLTLAYQVPADSVDNVYAQYAFLIKLRSLNREKSHFCEDAEHIQIFYPKAAGSLIAILNATKVKIVDRLDIEPILRLGQRVKLDTYISPLVDYVSSWKPSGAQARIAEESKHLDPELKKIYEELHPDPFVTPYTTKDVTVSYLEPSTIACVPALSVNPILNDDRKCSGDEETPPSAVALSCFESSNSGYAQVEATAPLAEFIFEESRLQISSEDVIVATCVELSTNAFCFFPSVPDSNIAIPEPINRNSDARSQLTGLHS